MTNGVEKKDRYTTIGRVILAFLIGASIGAFIIFSQYAMNTRAFQDFKNLNQYDIENLTGVFCMAFIIWLIALVILGAPIWFVLHHKKMTHWVYAVLFGFFVPLTGVMLVETNFLTGQESGNFSYYAYGKQQWLEGQLTTAGWLQAIETATVFGIYGIIISLVIWRVAYRHIK